MGLDMKIVEGEGYKITCQPDDKKVIFSGTLRLGGLKEYSPIIECLESSIEDCNNLSLDLKELDFLNSSGIAMFSKFVIAARGKQGLQLTILGSNAISWQGKSLKNLQRLMPSLNLIME